MHYLLVYQLAADYLERRPQYRNAHLQLAWDASARGELVLGGTAGDPIEGSLLLFRGDGPQVAERFAQADPYVQHGLVLSWRVLPWTTVVGETAAQPLRGV